MFALERSFSNEFDTTGGRDGHKVFRSSPLGCILGRALRVLPGQRGASLLLAVFLSLLQAERLLCLTDQAKAFRCCDRRVERKLARKVKGLEGAS